MRIKLYFLVSFACITSVSFSQNNQSVIASAGDVSKTSSIILEWTVGEPFTENSSSTSLYTQGFHQPVLQILPTSPAAGSYVMKSNVHVFPNPAASVINVQFDQPSEKAFNVIVIDVLGREVYRHTGLLKTSLLQINAGNFAHGIYFLKISNNKGSDLQEFKIIKAL